MNLGILQPGHRIRTRTGREAEVLPEPSSTSAGSSIRVAYLEEDGGPFGTVARTGEEDLLGAEDVELLRGVVPPTSWREQVVVVLHHLPESEEGPAEYRAETLSGVPNDVVVSGGSQGSSWEALNHLLGGLSLMGFNGTAIVEDGAGRGFDRYEIEVPDRE